ncbi:MAG: alpha-glucan family phosphorylase [Gammaproteobacteria bacterium]|nr:alpha-glucan family phosphorylase [Gammaproteobacteria bacterium]NIR84351.1 alpha-glucan family phosphorylase [Gammaproteobacteria bacterium]NIR89867.1 alpha-glucan family phosphorylase [Gammaproteobacteria bacterium]NIU05734.1 alpha-glucan family phosphorylase [Gammaproteobacteria bacterium]NIV52494.1 alpha-glucan family phosphorylase [Gammaproteobacteria bacterium]
MEVALRSDIPIYAGGLGVLAGDTVRSAADLEFPLVTVSLVSRAGYFRQTLDAEGRQVENPDPWDPARWAQPVQAKVSVPIEGRSLWIGGWLYVLEGHMGGRQPVVLLDTDLPENTPADREITHYLYGGDAAYRLKQEIVLGVGGVRMLNALGFRVRQYHLNEGHSALLTLELLRRHAYPPENLRPGEAGYDIPQVRELCNFTTHTPVEAGHDQFPYDLVAHILGEEFIGVATLKTLAGADRLNMTRLALNLSECVNGVAKRHAETSQRMFPGYRVRAITNGVHPFTWTSASFRRLYDAHLPGWCHEPELLVRADRIPDEAIWDAHAQAKSHLVGRIRELTGVALDPGPPLLGFARRMTAYKRPDLLFSDLARLRELARRHPFAVVLAGKAHPRDEGGKHLIAMLYRHAQELAGSLAVVYLPDYDMDLALAMTSGVDVWLNTPRPPLEASGTSGMKAAFNGVPSLSVLDGWWLEGCIEGVTGWAIGDGSGAPGDGGDAESLYAKLEGEVLPRYHTDRAAWISIMKGTIAKSASFFNSHRMMRRYASDVYIR